MGGNCIILVGAPGSGKTTIGKRISELTGCRYISSGDIAREIAIKDRSMRNDLDNGRLADEKTMMEEMIHVIREAYKYDGTFVLDGFPRHMDQYETLSKEELNIKYYFVVRNINKCMESMKQRGRDIADMDDKIILQRMELYKDKTQPMIMHITKSHNLEDILINDCDGNDHIDKLCKTVIEDMCHDNK